MGVRLTGKNLVRLSFALQVAIDSEIALADSYCCELFCDPATGQIINVAPEENKPIVAKCKKRVHEWRALKAKIDAAKEKPND